VIDLLLAALASALPLPLTGLVPWWAAALYALPLLMQVWRAGRGDPPAELGARPMNALSLACLALFVLDMAFLSRRLIQVAVHLSLSLIALKAFHLHAERDRAQFALLAFFLAVAGAANSTHPLLALHLLVLSALFTSWLLQRTGLTAGPARRLASAVTLACLVLAAPMFLLLPRLRGPYVPGGQTRAGEAETFTLDSLGLGGVVGTKDDNRVALRVRLEGGRVGEESLRLRVRTFDSFRKGIWGNAELRYRMRRFRSDGILWMGEREGKISRFLEIFPKDLSAQYLPLPYEAAGLEARLGYASAGNDGTTRLSTSVSQRQFHYRVFLDPAAAPVPAPWAAAHLALPEDLESDLRALAGEIMPDGQDPEAQIASLIRHFARGYRYAREDYSASTNPLREFLFIRKRGHCELYATAGALLLRARGIPARVAVGFLGGERNPLQDYYVVRFRNAHAWVEAWVNGGWAVVDPTPPEFRPALERSTLAGQVGFLWETVSFFWDRHVIGFALSDQLELAGAIGDRAETAGRMAAWLGLLLALTGAALWSARRVRTETGILKRYRRLRRRAAGALGADESTLAPEAVERAFLEREPALAEEAGEFFNAYRLASFGNSKGIVSQGARRAYGSLRRASRRWGRRQGQVPR